MLTPCGRRAVPRHGRAAAQTQRGAALGPLESAPQELHLARMESKPAMPRQPGGGVAPASEINLLRHRSQARRDYGLRVGLEIFARGPVRHHFATADETVASLRAAGFRDAEVYGPYDVCRPVDASARRHT